MSLFAEQQSITMWPYAAVGCNSGFVYLGFLLTLPFLHLHDKSVRKAFNPNKEGQAEVKSEKHIYCSRQLMSLK